MQKIERGQTLMKRIITIATAILLVSALLMTLTSCGSSDAHRGADCSSERAQLHQDHVPYREVQDHAYGRRLGRVS